MHSSKLHKIITSFTHEDWKEFNRFILGQAGEQIEAHLLFKYIARYKKNLKSRQLEIEVAHKTLYPAKTRKSFQNIMSKLTKIIEDYIRWHWILQNSEEYEICLLKAYNSRGLYHLFDLKSKHLRKKIKSTKQVDLWTDLSLLRISHDQFFSNNPIKSTLGVALLRNVSENIANFSIRISLFYQGVLEYFGEITNSDFSDDLKKISLFSIAHPKNDLDIYLKHFVLLNQNKDPESFRFLFDQLTKNKLNLSEEISASILMSLIHYAYEERKSGSSNTSKEILALNEFGVESGLLLVNHKITTTRFVNIVNAACACKEFDRAEQFIEQYSPLLDSNTRQETIQISIAQIRFYQHKYSEVIHLLKEANYHFFMHNIRMRWMLLCSYFVEYRDDTDFMESMIRNYHSFIKNNKQKISLSNYNGSINLSIILKSQLKDSSMDRLRKDLAETKEIVFRTWLEDLMENS